MEVNRRILMLAALAAAAPAMLGHVALVAAAEPRKIGKTFLIVHGGWEGPFAFARIVPPLAQYGHRVIAVELPGRGLSAQFPKSYFTPRDNPVQVLVGTVPLEGCLRTSVGCQRKERRAVMHSGFSIAADSNGGSHRHATRNG